MAARVIRMTEKSQYLTRLATVTIGVGGGMGVTVIVSTVSHWNPLATGIMSALTMLTGFVVLRRARIAPATPPAA